MGTLGTFARSHWRVSLRKADGRWRMTGVMPLRIGEYRPEGLTELTRTYLALP